MRTVLVERLPHMAVVMTLLFLAGVLGCSAASLAMLASQGQPTVNVPAPVVNNMGPHLPANVTPDKLPEAVLNLRWTRIDTPPGYPTVVRACDGTTGLYEDQYGRLEVTGKDPACLPGGKG